MHPQATDITVYLCELHMEFHRENDMQHCKVPEREPPLGEEHPIG